MREARDHPTCPYCMETPHSPGEITSADILQAAAVIYAGSLAQEGEWASAEEARSWVLTEALALAKMIEASDA